MTIENELLNLISGCLKQDVSGETRRHGPCAREPGGPFRSLFEAFSATCDTTTWDFLGGGEGWTIILEEQLLRGKLGLFEQSMGKSGAELEERVCSS